MNENDLSRLVVDICFRIHKQYGPGLFESGYEEIFAYEWNKTLIPFTRQQAIPLIHHEVKLEAGFRADLIIDNKIILEIKSVETLAPVHYKQLLTYLKLSNLKLGLLINFNVNLIKDEIHRIVKRL